MGVCPRARWSQDGSLGPCLQWGQTFHVLSPLLPSPGLLHAHSSGGSGEVSQAQHQQASASDTGGPARQLDDEHGDSGRIHQRLKTTNSHFDESDSALTEKITIYCKYLYKT